jgi:hypothetical protein
MCVCVCVCVCVLSPFPCSSDLTLPSAVGGVFVTGSQPLLVTQLGRFFIPNNTVSEWRFVHA